MASIIEANITDDGLNTLADHVVEITFESGCPIFEKGNSVIPAIYLVRQGKVKLVRPDGTTEEIIGGGSFGHEIKENTVMTEYSATALERTTCGVLSLPDCPVVFDECMIAQEAERHSPSTDLRLEDLTRHRVLGEGQFGEVFLVSSKKEKDPKGMALKIQAKDSEMRPDMVKAVWDEIKSMQRLKHGLLVSLITTFECAQNIYMLMTLAHGGELFDVIHQQDEDGEYISGIGEKGKFYAAVVADALAFMHRQKYVYRDLKPENVLIDEVGYPVLTDFGFGEFDKG
jgi:CRP-like cAMP-binding protein